MKPMNVKRACAGLGAALALSASVLVATPAHAATCVPVPVSTPGTNVTIAGDVHRVPAISNVSVCAGDGSVPLVWAETSGGSCAAACLAVVVRGGDVETGGITVSYAADGVQTSRTVDPGGIAGPGDSCLFGVGAPVAPRSGCLFAIEPDQVPVDDVTTLVDFVIAVVLDALDDAGGTVEDAEALARQLADDAGVIAGQAVEDACDRIPRMQDPDPYSYGYVRFCDDPVTWATYALTRVCEAVCDTDALLDRVCEAIEGPQGSIDCER